MPLVLDNGFINTTKSNLLLFSKALLIEIDFPLVL
jgi:hypothetical protein